MLGTYALCAGYYDAYYLKAQKVRTLIRRDFDQAFAAGRRDALARPRPTPPFKLGEKMDDPLAMYLTDIYTVAGEPRRAARDLASRAASTAAACPSGCSCIGRPFDEETLLRLAHAAEPRAPAAPPLAEGR